MNPLKLTREVTSFTGTRYSLFFKPITFTISEQGNYDVAEKPSNTLNNEKKLIKILVDNISTQVVDNLIARVNEL